MNENTPIGSDVLPIGNIFDQHFHIHDCALIRTDGRDPCDCRAIGAEDWPGPSLDELAAL